MESKINILWCIILHSPPPSSTSLSSPCSQFGDRTAPFQYFYTLNFAIPENETIVGNECRCTSHSESPLAQLFPAPVWPKTKLSGRKSWPKGPARTESMVPGRGKTENPWLVCWLDCMFRVVFILKTLSSPPLSSECVGSWKPSRAVVSWQLGNEL